MESRLNVRDARVDQPWDLGDSIVDDFQVFVAERCERERIDEVDDLAQGRIDEGPIAPNLADAKFSALPHIVVVRLRDRNIELGAHASLDCAEHLPLAFERVILGQVEGESQDTDNHRKNLARHRARLPASRGKPGDLIEKRKLYFW